MKFKTGGKGRLFNDRELAGKVRTLTLNEIQKALTSKGNRRFKEQLLLRLAGSVLPRLNEVSGADGKPLVLSFDPALKDVITSS